MTRIKSLLTLALATGLLGLAGIPAGADAPKASPPALGLYGAGRSFDQAGSEVLVRYERGTSSSRRAAARAAANAKRLRDLRVPGWEVVEARQGSAEQTAARLRAQPGVETAEVAGVAWVLDTTPNDDYFDNQWGLHNTGQVYAVATDTDEQFSGTADADVDAPKAWDSETGDASVVVAVVDTGILPEHPDLAGNLWTNPDELPNGLDDDANGYVDDINGWDFYSGSPGDNDPTDPSVEPHGSHVAGILGATGNDGTGIAGVSWDVKIMPLRVLGGAMGSGSGGDIADAMQYAVDEGADIVNLSLGTGGSSAAIKSVLDAAPNTLFVAAAGNEDRNNDARNIATGRLTSPTYPCNYTNANLICVAATTDADGLASFSNFGTTSVDLGAPGELILSAWSDYDDDGQYDWVFLDGTSMATPMVSGAAALLVAADPTATVAELREALLASGDAVGALAGKTVTGRRLNVASALTWLIDPPMFDDVLPSSSYYPHVQAIASDQYQIASGCSTNPPLYCPANNVTRAQMAVFVVKAKQGHDVVLDPYEDGFGDVGPTAWYAEYVQRMVDLGITSGCSVDPDLYCPGDPVTRAQMAVFLIRALDATGDLPQPATGEVFSDVPASAWYAPYVELLADMGITGGCTATKFCPGAKVARWQMAIFIANAWNLVP